jgi:hypothetical protein
MPEPEPNKKWDALLRAHAKKPHPEAQLHPVSRRALQEEVKKTYGTGEALPKKPGLFSHWWLRGPLAAGFAACAVLLILQNRRFEDTKSFDNPTGSLLTGAAPASAPVFQEEKAKSPAAQSFFGGRLLVASNTVEANGAVTVTTAGSAPVTDRLSGNEVNFQFQNQAATQDVLRSFRVERMGDRVQVTDDDGSVYAGKIAEPRMATNGSYAFAVHGVNHTLQQAVVFSGRLDAAGAQQGAVNGAAGNNLQALNKIARVHGVAKVGATNQIQVNAVPAP